MAKPARIAIANRDRVTAFYATLADIEKFAMALGWKSLMVDALDGAMAGYFRVTKKE